MHVARVTYTCTVSVVFVVVAALEVQRALRDPREHRRRRGWPVAARCWADDADEDRLGRALHHGTDEARVDPLGEYTAVPVFPITRCPLIFAFSPVPFFTASASMSCTASAVSRDTASLRPSGPS